MKVADSTQRVFHPFGGGKAVRQARKRVALAQEEYDRCKRDYESYRDAWGETDYDTQRHKRIMEDEGAWLDVVKEEVAPILNQTGSFWTSS